MVPQPEVPASEYHEGACRNRVRFLRRPVSSHLREHTQLQFKPVISIEWEATPPPELSDSAARASKRGYPTSLSPDTIEDDIDNTEYAFALLPCILLIVHSGLLASGSVFLAPLVLAKSRLSRTAIKGRLLIYGLNAY
jgi:hypothetical protein